VGRSRYCVFCYPETTVYYQDETIAIIQDKYRRGKLIITRDHYPMTKEALDEVFEIHAGTWHVSVDHMHIYYEPMESLGNEVAGEGVELDLSAPLGPAERCDLLQYSLGALSRIWCKESLSQEGGKELAVKVWSRWGQTLGRTLKADLPMRNRGVKSALLSLYTLATAFGPGGAATGEMVSEQEGFLRLEGCPRWRARRCQKDKPVFCHRLDDAFCQGFVQGFNPKIGATLTSSLPAGGDCCQVLLKWKDI